MSHALQHRPRRGSTPAALLAQREEPGHALLGLQRTIGNRAVQRLVAPQVQRCGDTPADQCGCHGGGGHADHPPVVARDADDPIDGLFGDIEVADAQQQEQPPIVNGTTIVMEEPVTRAINGTTPQQIESAMRLAARGGHVRTLIDVALQMQNSDNTGPVTAAQVTVTMRKSTHVWGEGRDEASDEHRPIIDRFFALISQHEDQHVAIARRTFRNAHRGALGRSAAQAYAHLDRVECANGRAQEAYDAENGCVRFTTNHRGAEMTSLENCELPPADYTSTINGCAPAEGEAAEGG